jgi:serine/threonine-protein kinase
MRIIIGVKMESARWNKLDAIYQAAMKLPTDEREEFLQKICSQDFELLKEAKALIQSNLPTAEFLKDNAFDLGVNILAEKEKKMGNTIDDDSIKSGQETPNIIGGRYEILEKLDKGGIGEVFSANDIKLKNKVVIKFLQKNANSNWLVEKFKDEAVVQSRVSHPNIAKALDKDVLPNGTDYLVMEFIDGPNISKIIQNYQKENEQIPFDLIGKIISQAGNGVDAIHKAKLIHRDLKPPNLMLTKDGFLKVIDFGIARDLTKGTSLNVVGTYSYMASEQLNGIEVSPATDVFAIGVIAYQLITLNLPFNIKATGNPNLDVVSHLRSRQEGVKIPPTLLRSDLPKEAETLISQALEYDPNKRPQNAKEFGDKLAEILARKPEKMPIIVHSKPNYSKPLLAFAAILLLALIGLGSWMWLGGGTKTVKADEIVKIRPIKPQTENKPAENTSNKPQTVSQTQPISSNEKPVYDAETNFPTGNAPNDMVFAQIGLTFWRSRPATPQDDRNTVARNTSDTEESVSERKDDFISNDEKIYFSIEAMTAGFLSNKSGYVYVINREQYADGTYGRASLIFPTNLTYSGNNLLKAGEPVILPRANGKPYKITRSSNKHIAETYTIIISPWAFQLPQPLSDKAMILPDSLVADWESKYANTMYRATLRNGLGKAQTIREQTVMSRSTEDTAEPLTQSETSTFPQTVYKGAVKIGNPAMFTVALKFKD